MPVSEVGGNTRVHIWHDLFESTKWKGHFTGIFLGPFQWDKGSISVKLPAVAPAVPLKGRKYHLCLLAIISQPSKRAFVIDHAKIKCLTFSSV